MIFEVGGLYVACRSSQNFNEEYLLEKQDSQAKEILEMFSNPIKVARINFGFKIGTVENYSVNDENYNSLPDFKFCIPFAILESFENKILILRTNNGETDMGYIRFNQIYHDDKFIPIVYKLL